jgi:FdhD protein
MIEPNATGRAPGTSDGSPREVSAPVVRVRGGTVATSDDWLAIERPLEIRARVDGQVRVVSTTMRTPGDDRALAAGFLYGERVIGSLRQIRALESMEDDAVLIELDAAGTTALAAAQRPFVTTGACGVCGRVSLEAIRAIPGRRRRAACRTG